MFIPASSKIPSPTISLIFCSPNFTTGCIEAFSVKGRNLLVALDSFLDMLKNLPKIKGLDSRVNPEHLRDMLFEVSADTRLNKYQKAVILAHMGVESFFNPFQQQVGGPAYGPMQFEADRQQEFKKYVNKYGTNFRSAVDYLVNTMILKPDTNKHWRYFGDKYPKAMDSYNTFKNAKDLNSALEASYYGYVRPKSSQNADSAKVELLKRLDLAQQFLKYLD